jgi:predicted NBD/HSP70 family sugar kinase
MPKVDLKIKPVLDPGFMPASLITRTFKAAVQDSGSPVPVTIALEQEDGSIFHFSTDVFPAGHPHARCNLKIVERLVKFALWSRGGYRIYFKGPTILGEYLKRHYTEIPAGRFDAEIMGGRIYEKPFECVIAYHDALPEPSHSTKPLGRHLSGCRIGFDLGASDRKVAAVIDGEPVFSKEIPWDPVTRKDPQWHFDQINEILTLAARHLPRVDAIGGSSAGVYVNNRVKVASLFRGVPWDLFQSRVKNIFLELKETWNNIPFDVVNDGEVTALAGSMALNDNAVLGIAMGSSEAVGYVTATGTITSWLNELAFAPVDYNPDAAVDEWSGDHGCGVQYFSQQCVGRLLKPAGITTDDSLGLPEKLLHVQSLMNEGDERAANIYKTIGAYLGYGVAHYADYYDIRNILLLGRVTTGPGGEIILDTAREVLKTEFPELYESIAFHTPDERSKRHGQAIAAASLPVISGK